MEYVKLFFNEWYLKPIEDYRIQFRDFLEKEFLKNATEDELAAWKIRKLKKQESYNNAKQAMKMIYGLYGLF